MGSAASTSAKPTKDVLLDTPMIRPPPRVRALEKGRAPSTRPATHESRAARAGHERAAVLREIFDSLDDGDFQISRAEYVRLMGTRGVAASEANAVRTRV